MNAGELHVEDVRPLPVGHLRDRRPLVPPMTTTVFPSTLIGRYVNAARSLSSSDMRIIARAPMIYVRVVGSETVGSEYQSCQPSRSDARVTGEVSLRVITDVLSGASGVHAYVRLSSLTFTALWTRSGVSESNTSPFIRLVGPATLTAPMAWPSTSLMGKVTQRSPERRSPLSCGSRVRERWRVLRPVPPVS